MQWLCEFGTHSLSIRVPKRKLLGHFHGPASELAGGTHLMRQAMAEPVDAPPLSSALVPGDHVTVVLDSGLPRADEVLIPLFEAMQVAEVRPEDITVLCTHGEGAANIAHMIDALPEDFEDVTVVTHNPSDDEGHAYLASTKGGRRIYLDRRATDADACVVVGRTGFDPLVGLRGTASYLFPALSNAQARRQSRVLAMDARGGTESLRARQICDEVAWLMGLFYGVGVALDRKNDIETIWFGQFQSVQNAANQHASAHWTIPKPAKSPALVVATVARSNEPARWDAVASALENAVRLCGPEGKVLLIADIAEPLGPTGRWLVDNENPWDLLHRLREAEDEDSLTTAQFAFSLSDRRIHLYSRLQADLVESLSMIPVANEREIEKLMENVPSIYLVEGADRARVASAQDRLINARITDGAEEVN
ncbi:MAG: lactate racemase domain-containing protein [Planctomycetota bacterium]